MPTKIMRRQGWHDQFGGYAQSVCVVSLELATRFYLEEAGAFVNMWRQRWFMPRNMDRINKLLELS
jgi:hypothetical protein